MQQGFWGGAYGWHVLKGFARAQSSTGTYNPGSMKTIPMFFAVLKGMKKKKN